jgi:tetratricopeptide (TPR) repeat protein
LYFFWSLPDHAQTQERIATFLRDAQRQYPTDLWITSTLAEWCRSCGQPDNAVRFYTAAVVLRPQNQHFVYCLGEALLNKGSPREAVAELSRVIEWNPNHVGALWSRGIAYSKLGQPDQVRDDFSRVLALGYRSPHAWYWRGWAYTHLGQWDKALADFSNYYDRSAATNANQGAPRLPAHVIYLPPPGLSYFRAYCCSVVGQWQKAAVYLKGARGIKRQPLASTPPNDTWFQLACLSLLQGDVPAYRQMCQQLLEREPKEGYSGLAAYVVGRITALHPECNTEAVRLAEKALAGNPKVPWYLHTMALAYYRAGQFEKAVQNARESQKAGPRWGGCMVNWVLLALAHQRLGQLDTARECRQRCITWRKEVLDGTSKEKAFAPPAMPLSDWLEFQVLYAEVVALTRPSD